MCGIVGFYNFSEGTERKKNIVRRMLSRIEHRGPDESGMFISDKVCLGSVRLSIFDIENGTMPINSMDDNYWIVFNGEVYNFPELKKDLVEKGYVFRTNTDTEVVLNMYIEYGSSFLNKLNGQFAIAIWNSLKEELFLARDRVGIRPLYYTKKDDVFVFGSEMKAFLEFPGIDFRISKKTLNQVLTFWTKIKADTFFEDFYEVPPGSFMRVRSSESSIVKYWNYPEPDSQSNFESIEDAMEEFEALYKDSIRLRMRADVPVAAYLSGGLDSSVTTSYIKDYSKELLQTFSLGFEEKEFDESSYQEIASNYFNTKHTGVTCKSDELLNHFRDIVWSSEIPVLRTSPIPMSLLAKEVRKRDIKVVITGEGADEILGGYNIFKESKIRRFWAKDPNSKYRSLLLNKLYPYITRLNNAPNSVLKMFFGYKLTETESPVYSHLLRWNNTSRLKKYLTSKYDLEQANYDPIEEFIQGLGDNFNEYSALQKAQLIELNVFMSGYLLSSQGDRVSMANSVEGRYPFLDHRIVEFCFNLPDDYKLKILNEKYILKRLMKGRIPKEILERSKQAYRAPIQSIFSSKHIPEEINRMLTEKFIEEAGIFDKEKVMTLKHKVYNSLPTSETDNMAISAIVSTHLLYDLFVLGNNKSLLKNDLIKIDKIIVEN